MIFVTIGTSKPFDRLLRALTELDLPAGEELVVQCGDSVVRPVRARCVGFLPFSELVDHVRHARLVIAHAGAGTVIAAVSLGVRPVVVPRLARFGEAADDHQVDFARHLSEAGLVTLVEDPSELPAAVAGSEDGRLVAVSAGGGALAADVRDYLRQVVGGVSLPVNVPPERRG